MFIFNLYILYIYKLILNISVFLSLFFRLLLCYFVTFVSKPLLKGDSKSFRLNGNSKTHFKASLGSFLGSGVPSIHRRGENRSWGILGAFLRVSGFLGTDRKYFSTQKGTFCSNFQGVWMTIANPADLPMWSCQNGCVLWKNLFFVGDVCSCQSCDLCFIGDDGQWKWNRNTLKWSTFHVNFAYLTR